MPRLKPEKLKELEKYTKAEIIEAIGRNFSAGYIVEDLLLDLKTIQMKKNLSDEREADRIRTEKLEAMLAWRKEDKTMKCPYRIITKITPLSENAEPGETQEFADCYGAECPFYIPENTRKSTPRPEKCGRVQTGIIINTCTGGQNNGI